MAFWVCRWERWLGWRRRIEGRKLSLPPLYGKITSMKTVIVGPQFEVIIPPAVRQTLRIQPGQEVQVIHYQNRIELIPVRPIQEARGMFRGMSTTLEREPDRL